MVHEAVLTPTPPGSCSCKPTLPVLSVAAALGTDEPLPPAGSGEPVLEEQPTSVKASEVEPATAASNTEPTNGFGMGSLMNLLGAVKKWWTALRNGRAERLSSRFVASHSTGSAGGD
jgi:hypothetical protein